MKNTKKLLEQIIRNQIAKDVGFGPTKTQLTKKSAVDSPTIAPPQRVMRSAGPISPYNVILQSLISQGTTLLEYLQGLGIEYPEVTVRLGQLFTPEQLQAIAIALSTGSQASLSILTQILAELIMNQPKRAATDDQRLKPEYAVAGVNMTKTQAAEFDLLLKRLLFLINPSSNLDFISQLLSYLELYSGGLGFINEDGDFGFILNIFLGSIRRDINFDILGNFTMQELIEALLRGSLTGSDAYPQELLDLGLTERDIENLRRRFFDYDAAIRVIRRLESLQLFRNFLEAGLGDQYEEWINSGGDVDELINILVSQGHFRISLKTGQLIPAKDSDLDSFNLNALMQIITLLKFIQNLEQVI